jgi:CubicO group peptidase (beta-lactamase class C family)
VVLEWEAYIITTISKQPKQFMKIRIFLILFVFSHLMVYSQPSVSIKVQPANQVKVPAQLDDGIKTGTLKEVQINGDIIKAMEDSILTDAYKNIHSVLILRHNKLVYENYFPGNDVVRGIGPVGFVDHHRDSLHDVRSVSKSVVSAALMIAIGQGKIKSVNERIFDFLPQYARYDTGMKRDITIQHLLNMSAGFAWDEDVPYSDTTNSEIRLNRSPDAIDFVLSQEMVSLPGEKFNYSGGCTQLLAAIIEEATDMEIDLFTEKYLFKPLGIEVYTWVKIVDGKPSAASGLRMRSRDMAKLGLLFLNEGKWNGEQIIPSDLVSQTLKSQIATPYFDSTYAVGYSNQFWIITEIVEGKKVTYAQAQGNGGQIIIIDKQYDLVLVITSGNYNQRDIGKSSWHINIDFVYPALIDF